MSTNNVAERLLSAVAGLQHYLRHDDDKARCVVCPRFDALQAAAMDAAATLEAAERELGTLTQLLRRYRTETPLGHQPHMIAHLVDAALAEQEG